MDGRPHFLIYGLNSEQSQEIERRCADLPVRLSIFHQPRAGQVPRADFCIVTKWTNHESSNAATQAGIPWRFHAGGISGLEKLIRERLGFEGLLTTGTPKINYADTTPPPPVPALQRKPERDRPERVKLYSSAFVAAQVGVLQEQVLAWERTGQLSVEGSERRRFPAVAVREARALAAALPKEAPMSHLADAPCPLGADPTPPAIPPATKLATMRRVVELAEEIAALPAPLRAWLIDAIKELDA